MERIDEIMKDLVAEFNYDKANSMLSEINSGKKLRSKLILKIADINEESLKLCAVVQMIHAASLLHDDVIDESDTRRGRPSINATFGSKNAIMLGDILYSKGYHELTKFDPFISQTISHAVSLLSIGELMDVSMGDEFNEDRAKYMEMIYNKTAVLIEASAKCGAFLKGLDTDKFGEYGKSLGIAFQIVDDILDIVSDSETLGKPAMSDYKEGKTTLPYIYLYEVLSEDDKKTLKSYFKKELNASEIEWMKAKLKEYKIIEKCVDEAREIASKGLKAIDEYKNDSLIKVMKSMVDREF